MSESRRKKWMALIPPVLLPTPFPVAILIAKAVKEVADSVSRQQKVDSKDAKNVSKIIKAGRESDVEEMTVRISKESGVGLDIAHSKAKVRATIGNHGRTEYELRVKYRETT
jgi:hypothetical protein